MLKVYGLKVSYFTGKLEGYLRYKEIPHEYCSATANYFTKILPRETGALQVPAVQLDDGRWMTDTSPMIDWFETQYPEHPILPADPVQAFISRLIEDYADEWLWRPAMHYRWSYPTSSKLLRRQIVDEMAVDLAIPKWLLRLRTEKRQFTNFVQNDGVTPENLENVERGYLHLLTLLTTIFEKRPYLFGETPTLADIGMFGPMFRHFSMDPVPAVIMRETASPVMEWVYRLWNARASKVSGSFVTGVPDDLKPLLVEIAGTHLEALNANAEAWAAGQTYYDVDIQGAPYRKLPTSHYRVWCLEELQRHFNALEGTAKADAEALLGETGCLEPLLRIKEPGSGYNKDGNVPFGANSLPVFPDIK